MSDIQVLDFMNPDVFQVFSVLYYLTETMILLLLFYKFHLFFFVFSQKDYFEFFYV